MYIYPVHAGLLVEVCKLARMEDEPALLKIIDDYGCLGFNINNYSPVEWLAEKGEVAPVNYLINYFDASEEEAICGYARGGHIKLVQAMLLATTDDTIQHFILYKSAIWGYALGGYVEEVTSILNEEKDPSRLLELQDYAVSGYEQKGLSHEVDLILEGEQDVSRRFFLHKSAITGAALKKNLKRVEELSTLESDDEERYQIRVAKVSGYSQNGLAYLVNDLISHERDPVRRFKFQILAICEYARGGKIDLVNQELQREKQADRLQTLKIEAVWGYSFSGMFSEVDKLIKMESDPKNLHDMHKNIVYASALVGHTYRIKKILEEAVNPNDLMELLIEAVYAYSVNGNCNKVNSFLEDAEDERIFHLLKDAAIKGYASAGYIEPLQTFLKDEQDPIQRMQLKMTIVSYLAKFGFFDSLNLFFNNENATKRHLLNKTYIYWCANSGFSKQVMICLLQEESELWCGELQIKAISGFVNGGYIKPLNELLLMICEPNKQNIRHMIVDGFSKTDYLDGSYDNVLYLTTHIEDLILRQQLYEKAASINPLMSVEELRLKTGIRHKLMLDNNWDYDQLMHHRDAWALPESCLTWFLQGIQLIKDKRIPLEIFLAISSYCLQKTDSATLAIFNRHQNIIPKALYQYTVFKKSMSGFKSSLESADNESLSKVQIEQKADERLQNRTTF